jgi:hypothetical protein
MVWPEVEAQGVDLVDVVESRFDRLVGALTSIPLPDRGFPVAGCYPSTAREARHCRHHSTTAGITEITMIAMITKVKLRFTIGRLPK